ncbi:Dabb family protein [Flavobacterium akiainvivens]|nr:Stress responsive A/B Barrel Domain [Flavobacterium akiainvivens]
MGLMLLRIPYILPHKAGLTIQGELKDTPEYDVMHYMTFRREEDIQLYYDHPTHMDFFGKFGETWEKFLVVNSKLV